MDINSTISVVMTVFNGDKFIKEAIDSILNQTFSDFEFIIVDNASTDRTKEIVSSYNDRRIILIENDQNLGQTKALRIGIMRSRGKFIARMDADDISLPERLELQYKYLEKKGDVAVVGTWHEEIDKNGKHIKFFKLPTDPLEIKCYLISPGELGYYCISHPTVLIRRNVLLETGFYNEAYRTQDYDLWVRVVRKYKLANLDQFLVKHRITAKQQSKEFKDDVETECEKIIIANIRYYLPCLSEEELIPLVRMLQYKPQRCKKDGLKVLNAFNIFFKKYMNGQEDKKTIKEIQTKIELFYLLQLIKTNTFYSVAESLRRIVVNPNILLDNKLYKKMARAILTN
ncbi:MAG: glycosyltransferase [Candidatus Omnitrophica bacterium]|nr:glycosyltransferase [Candidatus Omnitrophota bacterium]MDD5352372.1 glycosyltransferase [Candidatus Omnitrophota bacterium]MDD5549970.1 glycosyltransferase [Candidatus Omnitrophota bacterium]